MEQSPRTVTLSTVALSHVCPACGKGSLYRALLKIAPACNACGLSFGEEDTGDGPAFFVIIVVGFLITLAASITEYVASPPLWLHGLIWIPLTFVSSIWMLRVFKSALIGLQYRTSLLKQKESSHD